MWVVVDSASCIMPVALEVHHKQLCCSNCCYSNTQLPRPTPFLHPPFGSSAVFLAVLSAFVACTSFCQSSDCLGRGSISCGTAGQDCLCNRINCNSAHVVY
jgi:hypothetical protein